MLLLKPNCECCDRDLPPEATDARMCTFEMYLLRRLRRTALRQCLPELRRQPGGPSDPAGQAPGEEPGLDQTFHQTPRRMR